MIRRTSAAALALVVGLGAPSTADDPDVGAGTGNGGLFATGTKAEDPGRQQGVRGPLTPNDTPEITLGESACAGASLSVPTVEGITFCVNDPQDAGPVLTVGLIRRAFAELPLPAGELVIQPPDGLTLVNFDTNFYTTSTRPIRRTVTLLGQRVTLEATPATFHWDFDDGGSLSTSKPGAPYPRLDVTHNYLRAGTYRPSLSTTYSGRFRVGGGAWQQIPGTVTIDGAGQALRAIEAEPRLVGY